MCIPRGGSHRVCVGSYDCETLYHTSFHAFKQLNMKTQLHFHMTLSHSQWEIAHSRTLVWTDWERAWVQAGSNFECDTRLQGEVYLQESSKKIPKLDQCKKSCRDSADCRSITHYKSGWCSHFSTPCTKVRPKTNANVWRLNASSSSARAPDRFQAPYLLGKLSVSGFI